MMWYDLIYVCKRHSFSVIGPNYYVHYALNMQVMESKQQMELSQDTLFVVHVSSHSLGTEKLYKITV